MCCKCVAKTIGDLSCARNPHKYWVFKHISARVITPTRSVKHILNGFAYGICSECLYCFHYPDSLGYLIFCCHGVAKGFTFILTVAE